MRIRDALGRLMTVMTGALLLAACSAQDANQAGQHAAATETPALPVPGSGRGGVTGMPAVPGPGATGTPDPGPAPSPNGLLAAAADVAALPPGADPVGGADEAAVRAPQAPFAAPTPQDAVAVMRGYYAALDSGSFAQAYRLWSQDGAASGQSLQQFAHSFGGVARRRVELMTPGRIDAAAGSHYVEVPLAIEETGRDGRVHRYAGAYTLRRAAADDANAGQHGWRISSADLREVRP